MKNKIFNIIIGAAIICSALTSCKKEFLNIKPYNSVVLSEAIKNEADLSAALNGLYSSLRATDFYGRTYAVKGDLMSDIAFLSSANSGRYLQFSQYNMAYSDGYANNIWSNGYTAIKNANFIINSGIVNNTDNVSQMLSEAYAVRAMVLFDLCRNFARPYSDNPDGLGVPIVLKFDLAAKPSRNTIKEVYNQVIADLDQAYTLAKFNQGVSMNLNGSGATRILNSSFISKYAIKCLQARVYQNKGDWDKAKSAALEVVNNAGFSLTAATSLVGYWKGTSPRTDKVETMFEITSDGNNQVGDGTLAAIYVPKNAGGSYGDILATNDFYKTYSATDVRKQLYNVSTRSGQIGSAIYVTKYPTDYTSYDDVKICRYAEVLLILAESYYNLGAVINANLYLNMVAQKRDPSFVGYSSVGSQILEDILNERKKEFAFEGYRFWDLYRLKRSFVKPQAQDINANTSLSINVTPATLNYILPISFEEMLVNPNMVQNPGY